jgi:hypothetical protein
MATIVNGSTGVSQVQETVTLKVISTGSVPSLEAKGTSGVTSGYLELKCSENTHGIKLLGPPHSAGADYTLTFPNNDGDAGQFLQSNGSGVMSWAAAGGGLTQIVDFATTSGTTVTSPALDLSTYKLIYLVCNKIGCASDTGGPFQLTPNGGSIVDFAGGFGPTVNLYGGWWIDLSNGIGQGSVNITTAAAVTVAASSAGRTFVNTGISTSTTSIAFTTAGTVTFNLGNIKIYGLK